MEEGFKKLTAWQKAYNLALDIYKITKNLPKEEQYALTSQIRRAAVSISANIAEGYQRQHRKEYLQFLNIAKGSLGELETYIMFLKDLEYIDSKKHDEVQSECQEVGKILNGLIRSLRP
ncbi:MAG: four helix bundle protein [Candidatus Omnitrophica bacterium]|nr:four helix bundle protein [Candidatus Omnitrophota bacterium]